VVKQAHSEYSESEIICPDFDYTMKSMLLLLNDQAGSWCPHNAGQ